MKKTVLILVVLMSISASAQKYFTKIGKTEFKASKETLEPIEAINESTTVILNTENGEIASLLFVKGLHFKIALMEEHFNENYMESDKFPKATFKGQLVGFDFDKLSQETIELPLKGDLNIRGKQKVINAVAEVKKEGGKIIIKSNFDVKAQDFNIKIPSIVKEKIANNINIILNYELEQKK